MKLSSVIKSLRHGIRGALAASTLVLLSAAANASGPVSPVGDWDLVISGSGQSGLASITFSDDGTFSGQQILVPALKKVEEEGRNPGGDTGRNFDTNTVGDSVLFGFGPVSGPWQFDEKGHVVGFFTELVGEGHINCTTNENISEVHQSTTVPLTNVDGSISFFTTNITIFITNAPIVICVTNAAQTNAVSFSAKVVSGKRLTLTASTVNGKVTYRGVPLSDNLRDFSGSWMSTRKQNGQVFLELYDLMPFGVFSNSYNTEDGQGPGYEFEGVVMVSSQKKVAYTFKNSPDGLLRSAMGSFDPQRAQIKVTAKGLEDGVTTATFSLTSTQQSTP